MRESPTVAVVVTTCNHAHFLGDALTSIRAQTRAPDSVLVVDDGSADDPASIVRGFPGVELIRQPNRGLSAARNRGLAAVNSTCIVFLDADDWLEPCAIEAGLDCFAAAPERGLVYGGHRSLDPDGRLSEVHFVPAPKSPYLQLLRRNYIGMHGAVMYRRECLQQIGGFDGTLKGAEDYDVYLRMARRRPLSSHANPVAVYRRRVDSMSGDCSAMLRVTLHVHARHRPPARNAEASAAWMEGRRAWRRYFARAMADARYRERRHGTSFLASLPALAEIAAASPAVAFEEILGGLGHRLRRPGVQTGTTATRGLRVR